jgi:hypothetical protein
MTSGRNWLCAWKGNEISSGSRTLLADDFDEGAFSAAAIEFAVENLFPRPEVEFAVGDGDDNFAAHDLAFKMGIGIVLAGAVVAILGSWRMRRKFFEPDLIIVKQAFLGVVNENGGGDVHGVDEAKALADAAFADQFLNRRCDVHESPAIGNFKPQLLGERLHSSLNTMPATF